MLHLKIENRLAPRASLYFDICQKSHFEAGKAKEKQSKIKMRSLVFGWPASGLWEVGKQRLESAITTTVFAALCLEAFIYDYATTHLSANYVKNFIDKLDLVSKWVVVTRIVLGKDFPRESQAFEHLRILKKARDKLVHAKSQELPSEHDKFLQALNDLESEEKKVSELAYHTVIEVLTQLRELDEIGETTKWWTLED